MIKEIIIEKHINRHSSSNTYILSLEDEDGVWVLDPGDSDFIINWLSFNMKKLKGILVTHSHIDHIYGINDLQNKFQSIKVHASSGARNGMLSTKLNLSHFHGQPLIVERKDIVVLNDKQKLELWNDIFLTAHYTPGHNKECLSYELGDKLFTGDALIPGMKVFTKFRGGNKIEAAKTIKMIFETFSINQIIYPGHGEVSTLEYLKNDKNLI